MRRSRKPTLKFGETRGEIQGFTSWKTASFNDLPPARVIREILQNSLDAAVEAKEKPAVVRFRVTKIKDHDIPDIAGYRKAFREAVVYHQRQGELPDAAQHVVNTIEATLENLAKDGHYLLAVSDNGVGLNERRMKALFSDGTSVKATNAAGSYGVGHFAAISASDLHYLLYGGVLENGKKLAAGYAVLASRPGKKCWYSAQGYLIKKFAAGMGDKLYDFLDSKSIPEILSTDLERIREEWKHGTVISIPAFNYFGDYTQSLSHIVSKIASYNFGVAIHRGDLVIEIDESEKYDDESELRMMRLDNSTLGGILEEESKQKRAPRKNTFFEGLRPSGQNAHSIYEALVKGAPGVVETNLGKISVNLLAPAPTENTRIDLFRNGMWITDEVSRLKRADFADRQPFHAVLVPQEGHELHRLVRKAEGPMHDKLSLNLLDQAERKKLINAFGEITVWIKEQIPELGDSVYTPDDFLVVPTGGEGIGGGPKRFEMWGRPTVVHRSRVSQRIFTQSDGEDDNHELEGERKGEKRNKRSKKKTRRTLSSPLPFQSTVVPDGKGSHIISLRCKEAFDDVTLSLKVDENMDATCDRIWSDEKVTIRSFELNASGAKEPMVEINDEGDAIRLCGLLAGKTYKLALKHDSPEGLENAVELPVLRVDLSRTRLESNKENSENVNDN